jgi:hypothetical protein
MKKKVKVKVKERKKERKKSLDKIKYYMGKKISS